MLIVELYNELRRNYVWSGTGDPITVLTTENIASVYEVEAAVKKQSKTPHVVAHKTYQKKKRSTEIRYGIFD